MKMNGSKVSGLDIFVGLVLAIMLVMPINAVLYANTAVVIWDWFLTPQYGSGPSLAGWYGISIIVGLLTIHLNSRKDETEVDSVTAVAIISVVKAVIVCLLTLGSAALVRTIAGW